MTGYRPLYPRNNANRYVKALGTRLSAGHPACIGIQGDSTGASSTRWPYLVAQWLASKIASHTVTHRLWNDTHQAFDPARTLGTGASGDAYALMPKLTGSYISTPDKASLRVAGDLDIAVKIGMDDWTLTNSPCLVAKFTGGGKFSYALALDRTRAPFLWWSTDGTNQITKFATAALPTQNGVPIWLRATLDVDNGAGGYTVTFYTSSDGVTWNQLGSAVVAAGSTSIFASTAVLELGSRGGGTGDLFGGKIYAAIVRNGIGGQVVASPDLDLAFPSGTTIFRDAESNVWTIAGTVTVGGSPGLLVLNASCSGKNLAYSADATRFALQTPIEPQLAFINYGHNQWDTVEFQAPYEAFAQQLLTAFPNVGVVCTAQNPQRPPEVNIIPHAIRCRQISALAATNDYGLIDAYRLFTETGDLDSYMTDGCHPNDAGNALWADEVKRFLQPAVM